MVSFLLLLFVLSSSASSLRALLTSTSSEYAELLYGRLDSETGSFSLISNWTQYGACTGGHAWADGGNGMTAVTTLFLNSSLNWVYLFNEAGVPQANFSSELVFDVLQWSAPQQSFVTATIVAEAMNIAQISWKSPFVTPRVSLRSSLYEAELDVSAIDERGIFYIFATSDSTQNVYLISIDTSSWNITQSVNSQINMPVMAMEWFQGYLLCTVQSINASQMWLEVFRVNPATGESKLYASLSPNWGSTLSASAVDKDTGTLYLGVGISEDPPTLWRVATVTTDGAVTFSQPFSRPILSLLT
jgi:hypothetical protein